MHHQSLNVSEVSSAWTKGILQLLHGHACHGMLAVALISTASLWLCKPQELKQNMCSTLSQLASATGYAAEARTVNMVHMPTLLVSL